MAAPTIRGEAKALPHHVLEPASVPVLQDESMALSKELGRLPPRSISSFSDGEVVTDGSFQKETGGGEGVNPKQSWWRKKRQFNPLRWGPVPPIPTQMSVSKEADAGFLSKTTFAWVGPLMRVGYSRPLESADIPLVAPNRSSTVITDKLQASFDRRRSRGDRYPLLWSLNKVFFREFWFCGFCRIAADCLLITAPFVLKCVTHHPPDQRFIGLASVRLLTKVSQISHSVFS